MNPSTLDQPAPKGEGIAIAPSAGRDPRWRRASLQLCSRREEGVVHLLPMSAPRVVVAYGTRPEKIKLAPLTRELREKGVEVVEWFSGQSKDLLAPEEVARLDWMGPLAHNVSNGMRTFHEHLLAKYGPFNAVIVQGDTATAFACAQAAFLARVPVAHVEAGLRTYREEPWPEEAFRRQIAAVARWHFAPDETSADNVFIEITGGAINKYSRAKYGVHVTGNTIIDTLPSAPLRVLATLHRRENWGTRRVGALQILDDLARRGDISLNVIHHPNWNQDGAKSDHAIPPIVHDDMLRLIRSVDLIVTDSGGLQEEAAHFGTSCLVFRTSTERVALERCGAVTLVDPDDPEALRREMEKVLARRRCYGEGDASRRIAEILVGELTRVDNNATKA